MQAHPSPFVTDVERWNGGVIITFDDGKDAVYSASLLRAFFDQAQEVSTYFSANPESPSPGKE